MKKLFSIILYYIKKIKNNLLYFDFSKFKITLQSVKKNVEDGTSKCNFFVDLISYVVYVRTLHD